MLARFCRGEDFFPSFWGVRVFGAAKVVDGVGDAAPLAFFIRHLGQWSAPHFLP